MTQRVTVPGDGGDSRLAVCNKVAVPCHFCSWAGARLTLQLCQPRRLHKAITGSRRLRVLLEAWPVTRSQGLLKVKRRWHPRAWFKCSCECAAAQSGNPGRGFWGDKTITNLATRKASEG